MSAPTWHGRPGRRAEGGQTDDEGEEGVAHGDEGQKGPAARERRHVVGRLPPVLCRDAVRERERESKSEGD